MDRKPGFFDVLEAQPLGTVEILSLFLLVPVHKSSYNDSMQKVYLTPEDADAFLDREPLVPPTWLTDHVVCPRCRGYGGWNLAINQYSLHGREDTAENRVRYSHFGCMCNHCNGAGYVDKWVTCPGHEWKIQKNLGRCYNRYVCTVCSVTQDVDSSD